MSISDTPLLIDILGAAAKLLAQKAVNIRYNELGNQEISTNCVGTLNAAVRCLKLADEYKSGKPQ